MEIRMNRKVFEKFLQQERREVAEAFLQLAYDWFTDKRNIKVVEELAEKFGVEIEEK